MGSFNRFSIEKDEYGGNMGRRDVHQFLVIPVATKKPAASRPALLLALNQLPQIAFRAAPLPVHVPLKKECLLESRFGNQFAARHFLLDLLFQIR
jgi:hypothetical protein